MDNLEEMGKFIEKYNLPILNQEEIKNMNRPTTRTETESVIKASGVFSVEFIAEPYEYETSATGNYSVKSFTIANKTTTTALPVIKIYGTGTVVLNINGRGITITGLTSDITLDSELQEAYTGLTTNMNSSMNGEFPVLKIGSNTITWTGTVTKVEIDPKWRWLT